MESQENCLDSSQSGGFVMQMMELHRTDVWGRCGPWAWNEFCPTLRDCTSRVDRIDKGKWSGLTS